MTPDERRRLVERADAAGVGLSASLADALAEYFDLLARWNRRMNLTAFNLDSLSDEAIDRLLVEPVVAAQAVRADERWAIDIGSGGGSPAVPFALAASWLSMTLVEVRAKKAAFLREVARTVSVKIDVQAARIEDVASGGLRARMDLVTFRAVRSDRGLWTAIDALLVPAGRVFWFGGAGQIVEGGGFIHAGRVGAAEIVERSP